MDLLKTLLEIFNHNAPGDWEIDDNIETKTFVVNDETYRIRCVLDNIDDVNFVVVSFAHVINGNPSLDLTNLNNGSGKVLATVMNSVWERFNKLDAFIFSSKDDATRTQAYAKIAAHFGASHNLIDQKIKYSDGGAIFVLKKQHVTMNLSDVV